MSPKPRAALRLPPESRMRLLTSPNAPIAAIAGTKDTDRL